MSADANKGRCRLGRQLGQRTEREGAILVPAVAKTLHNHYQIWLALQVFLHAKRFNDVCSGRCKNWVNADVRDIGGTGRHLAVDALKISRRVARNHRVSRCMQDGAPFLLPRFISEWETEHLGDHVVADKERRHLGGARVVSGSKKIAIEVLADVIKEEPVFARIAIAMAWNGPIVYARDARRCPFPVEEDHVVNEPGGDPLPQDILPHAANTRPEILPKNAIDHHAWVSPYRTFLIAC